MKNEKLKVKKLHTKFIFSVFWCSLEKNEYLGRHMCVLKLKDSKIVYLGVIKRFVLYIFAVLLFQKTSIKQNNISIQYP